MQQKEPQRKIIKGQSAAISVLRVTELVLSVSFLFPLDITYLIKRNAYHICINSANLRHLLNTWPLSCFKFG